MALSVTSRHYQLPLKYPFTISRYTVETQHTVIVSISNGEFTGYGEATVNPYYGSTVEKIERSVNKVKSIIESSILKHPEEFWLGIELYLQDDYFALCAIDCAYWDLYAKIHAKTLRSFFCNPINNTPLTNYTIGIDSIDAMKSKILEKPWPIYKIKLGTANDIKIVESLREITDSVFRIDANASWTAEEALKNIKHSSI